MKKIFCLLAVFFLCGCTSYDNVYEKTVDNINSTNYVMAKNSMFEYVKSIEIAYTEYQYGQITGDYVVSDESTLVNVDGVDIKLNVNSYSDLVKCSSIYIVNGKVKLNDCVVNGYKFSFDGEVIDK